MIEIKNTVEKVKVRFTKDKYEIVRNGACWDLRAACNYTYEEGISFYLDLGVNIKLPDGCFGILVPRSSTFKNYGLIQTNSIGIIENNYCGNDDVWKMPVYAVRSGEVRKGDRVAQFMPMSYYPDVEFEVVEDMNQESRGGFGSTGV